MERIDQLAARLSHLGYLGEELEQHADRPGSGWVFRQIVREAARVADIATAYVGEHERARAYLDATPADPLDGYGPNGFGPDGAAGIGPMPVAVTTVRVSATVDVADFVRAVDGAVDANLSQAWPARGPRLDVGAGDAR
ncbi:hypothetical protein [Umezawaea sp. Da 62-37]|uniref:hypothetical protein n=1 Tax=Umezawaea sp. Da 62-37 TaxID=3075927 RepID=UPI0028F70591|nr:hypothetical protein [Umezawaea sp. Da 62-37]WNV83967.1 hypothetical protein RM788_38260 [Umezawaea sp. Da 62-37]